MGVGELLQEAIRTLGDDALCAVFGSDGLLVEFSAAGGGTGVDEAGAELAPLFAEASRVMAGLDLGQMTECYFRTDSRIVFVHQASPEYLLILRVGSGEFPGKARHVLSRLLPRLRQEL